MNKFLKELDAREGTRVVSARFKGETVPVILVDDWNEGVVNCARCGIETSWESMLCDDCNAAADAEDREY